MNSTDVFPATVFLIDVVFLNRFIKDTKDYFENHLKQSLPDIDISDLLTYMGLDAGLTEGEGDSMVLMISDESLCKLNNCRPSDLRTELNGVAFRNNLGEFSFNSYFPEGMVKRNDFFLDYLTIILDMDEVKRIIIVGDEPYYGSGITMLLTDTRNKKIIRFGIEKPEPDGKYLKELLPYPLMRAFHIKGDELG